MTLQGILVLDAIGLLFIVWIVNLVRTGKLHVGYGVLWLVASGAVVVLVSVPPLLAAVTAAVGALFPASALSLLGFVFVFATLILFSVQLSKLSERQERLVETIGLLEMRAREQASAATDPASATSDREGSPVEEDATWDPE